MHFPVGVLVGNGLTASTLDKGITYTQPDGSNPKLSIQGWSDVRR